MTVPFSTICFDIVYRPGKSNIDADVLSRYPGNLTEQTAEIPSESVKVLYLLHVRRYSDYHGVSM